jgi:hypothetical protein
MRSACLPSLTGSYSAAVATATRVFEIPVVLTTVETSGRMAFASAVAHLHISFLRSRHEHGCTRYYGRFRLLF